MIEACYEVLLKLIKRPMRSASAWYHLAASPDRHSAVALSLFWLGISSLLNLTSNWCKKLTGSCSWSPLKLGVSTGIGGGFTFSVKSVNVFTNFSKFAEKMAKSVGKDVDWDVTWNAV